MKSLDVLWVQIQLAALLAGWLFFARRRGLGVLPTLCLPLGLIAFTWLRALVDGGMDADESEHLHLAYLVSQHVLPYLELEQNHSPLLWMLMAPWLRLFPETPYVLFFFRALVALAFLASAALAASLLRALPVARDAPRAALAFLLLCAVVPTELYRLRPDPFMTTAALASLACLVHRRPARFAAPAAGLLQGVALAFSPKIAPLVLLAPLAALGWPAGARRRALLGYAAGLLLPAAPLLVWLAASGQLGSAWSGIVTTNLDFARERVTSFSPGMPRGAAWSEFYNPIAPSRLVSFGPLAALAGFGLWRLRADPTARLLGLALLLWLGVWGLTANLLTYHVAGAALLAAVLAAPALAELLTGRASAWRDLCVATLLVLCMGSWIFRTGVLGETPGVTLAVRDVAWLQRAVARRGGSCLCVAPYHPIFVRDAPRVFRYHELFSPRWAEAVDWALERRPGAIVSLHDPRVLVALGSLDEPRRQALAALLRRGYRAQHLAEARVWLAPLPRAPARARAGAAPM